MGRLLGVLPVAFTYFCVGTVLSLGVGLGMLASKGVLSEEKLFQILAIVQGVDLTQLQIDRALENQPSDHDDVAFDDVVLVRATKSLDLDLREQAMSRGLEELNLRQVGLKEDRDRYTQLKNGFDAELLRLQKGAQDTALTDLQRILESMSPKQAKDHILRILPSNFADVPADDLQKDEQEAVIATVTVMKAMSDDKSKKIIAEFKEENDAVKLAAILRLIRLGTPEVDLIDTTRESINNSANQN